MVRAEIEHAELSGEGEERLLAHVRGRYVALSPLEADQLASAVVTTVLLIRHGRTAANTSGILAGRASGVELDDLGVKQAAEAGTRMGSVPLRAIATSPLRRCRQTAQALQAARTDSCPILVDQALVECGYGDWTGRAARAQQGEAVAKCAAPAIGCTVSRRRIDDGDVEPRGECHPGWDRRLATEHGADAIWAAVSHGDVIKAILADALGMHLDSFQRLLVDPGSVSVVRYTSVRPYVVTVNSTTGDLSDLYRARPPKTRGRRTKNQTDASVGVAWAPRMRSTEPAGTNSAGVTLGPMAILVHRYDSPDRFVAGTVGQPGERTFFLQAREGNRITSVVCEKQSPCWPSTWTGF